MGHRVRLPIDSTRQSWTLATITKWICKLGWIGAKNPLFSQSEYNFYNFRKSATSFTQPILKIEETMNETNDVEFILEVGSADATDEERDQMARQLLSELNDLDVESAELEKGETPQPGTKGDPITTGSIAIAVLPALLPKIVETIQGWLLRGTNHTVKFKSKVSGQTIDFEGSSEDLQKILAMLSKVKKKK
jgi:hypothetical protein